MPGYDALHYDPPAPVAQVMLRAADGAIVSDVLMLLDTGADATLIPRSAVARLGINPDPAVQYASHVRNENSLDNRDISLQCGGLVAASASD